MDTTLAATPRQTARGKSAARKVRKAGKLPAVIYGPGSENLSVEVDPRTLTEMFRKSQDRNTVVQLKVDGKTVPALVREVQRHPLSREILHVDFYRVAKERPVVVEVPVAVTGKAAGLALGGRVLVLRRTLWVKCAYDAIPTVLTIDVTPMNIGDTVQASQVVLPSGVALSTDTEFPVIQLAGKLKERVEEAPVAAAAPAEGAEAAAEAPKKDDKK
jgi:large subunit ribosomal protein L25